MPAVWQGLRSLVCFMGLPGIKKTNLGVIEFQGSKVFAVIAALKASLVGSHDERGRP